MHTTIEFLESRQLLDAEASCFDSFSDLAECTASAAYSAAIFLPYTVPVFALQTTYDYVIEPAIEATVFCATTALDVAEGGGFLVIGGAMTLYTFDHIDDATKHNVQSFATSIGFGAAAIKVSWNMLFETHLACKKEQKKEICNIAVPIAEEGLIYVKYYILGATVGAITASVLALHEATGSPLKGKVDFSGWSSWMSSVNKFQ